MDTLATHTIEHLMEGIDALKRQLAEKDRVIQGQAMHIIELMAQVREADPVGMGLTAEELDDMEMIQEERKRERLEEERSYRADMLDEM